MSISQDALLKQLAALTKVAHACWAWSGILLGRGRVARWTWLGSSLGVVGYKTSSYFFTFQNFLFITFIFP